MESVKPPVTPSGADKLSEISSRLQEGWTLLNHNCPMPRCNTPLLKDSRQDGQGKVYCVKCGMYCITAGEAKGLNSARANGTNSHFADANKSQRRQQQSSLDKECTAVNGVMPSTPLQTTRSTAAASREAARADADKRMGEKLLLGWTMLADMCPTPDCCFPLMLDMNGDTICVACGGDGLPVQAEPQSDKPLSAATISSATHAPAFTVTSPPVVPAVEQRGDKAGAVLSQSEFAAVRKRRDDVSAALGRFMLQGWSMLERTCPRQGCEPGTPLLKDRRTGILFCASCETYDRGSRELGSGIESQGVSPPNALPVKRCSSGEERKLPYAESPTPATNLQSMQVESAYEIAERARLRKQATREQQMDPLGASTGIAQRLLQGWTMLSAPCPTPDCHNPLMRDKAGTVSCVMCGSAPVVRPEPSETVAQAAGDVMEQDDEEDPDGDREMLDDAETRRMYTDYPMAELNSREACGAPATVASMNGGLKGTVVVDHGRIKMQALDALYGAIDVSQQRLRSCTEAEGSTTGVDESGQQAELIAKLAIAARALSDLGA